MSEQKWVGTSAATLDIPAVRRAFAATGVPIEQAAANLRAAAQHFDPAEFEAMIAATRPKAWTKMNQQPSRWCRILRRRAA